MSRPVVFTRQFKVGFHCVLVYYKASRTRKRNASNNTKRVRHQVIYIYIENNKKKRKNRGLDKVSDQVDSFDCCHFIRPICSESQVI